MQDIDAWRFPLKPCAVLERERVIFGRYSTLSASPAWWDGNSCPEACTRSDFTARPLDRPPTRRGVVPCRSSRSHPGTATEIACLPILDNQRCPLTQSFIVLLDESWSLGQLKAAMAQVIQQDSFTAAEIQDRQTRFPETLKDSAIHRIDAQFSSDVSLQPWIPE